MHLIFKQRFTVTFDVAGRKLLAVNGFSPKFIHHVIARILGHGQSREKRGRTGGLGGGKRVRDVEVVCPEGAFAGRAAGLTGNIGGFGDAEAGHFLQPEWRF